MPGVLYADLAVRGFRWSVHDDLAAELKAGLVVRLEVIARVIELRDHNDGARWQIEILEVSKSSDE